MKPVIHKPANIKRSTHLREELREELSRIADANAAGYSTEETIGALRHAIKDVVRAYLEDPDPADDPS